MIYEPDPPCELKVKMLGIFQVDASTTPDLISKTPDYSSTPIIRGINPTLWIGYKPIGVGFTRTPYMVATNPRPTVQISTQKAL
jgi:hypothetical protein